MKNRLINRFFLRSRQMNGHMRWGEIQSHVFSPELGKLDTARAHGEEGRGQRPFGKEIFGWSGVGPTAVFLAED